MIETWLDIRGYAALIGVPWTWVRDKVTAREIEFERVGRHVRFSQANHEANQAAWRERPVTATAPILALARRRSA